MSLARFVFIPLFLFCNASPYNRSLTPVVFDNDFIYLLIMLTFSLSTGYVGAICMMFAPKALKTPEEQGAAASIMVSFLVLGLAVGSVLSQFTVMLL